MNIDARKFGFAMAVSFSVVWAICSVFVMLMPNPMMAMSGDMSHMDLSAMGWQVSFIGLVRGLIGWAVLSGLFGWLLATVYNKWR